MTTPEPLPEHLRSRAWSLAKPAAMEEWQRGSADTVQMLRACSKGLDAALTDLVATIDALTARAEAAEQQAVVNDIERAGWQASAEAAEAALAEGVRLLRECRWVSHVAAPCDCVICAFIAVWNASEGVETLVERAEREHPAEMRAAREELGESPWPARTRSTSEDQS